MVIEDKKGELLIIIHGLMKVDTGLVPWESRGRANIQLHPILYSVYLMGEGGLETLKQFRKEKWQIVDIEAGDQVDETPPKFSSKDPKEVTLYQAVTSILDAWENKGTKIAEGSEKVQMQLMERL